MEMTDDQGVLQGKTPGILQGDIPRLYSRSSLLPLHNLIIQEFLMKKTLIAFALLGMALIPSFTVAPAAFASDSSSIHSPLAQDTMLSPW